MLLHEWFSTAAATTFTMVNSLTATFLVRVPTAYVLGKGLGMGIFGIGFGRAAGLAGEHPDGVCLFQERSLARGAAGIAQKARPWGSGGRVFFDQASSKQPTSWEALSICTQARRSMTPSKARKCSNT